MKSAKASNPKTSSNKFAVNEEFNTSTAKCPNVVPNTRESCDIDLLKVGDTASGRSVEITRSCTKDLVPKDAPPRVVKALYRYDAVLELLSAYDRYTGDSKDAKEKNVKLVLKRLSLANARRIDICCYKLRRWTPRTLRNVTSGSMSRRSLFPYMDTRTSQTGV